MTQDIDVTLLFENHILREAILRQALSTPRATFGYLTRLGIVSFS
jgi:hypothetical protein